MRNVFADKCIYPDPSGEVTTNRGEKGQSALQAGPYEFTKDGFLTFTISFETVDKQEKLRDWSFVAWGESGEVYVYKTDGSKTSDWGKSTSMEDLGPQNKPETWDPVGKNAMRMPNKQRPWLRYVVNDYRPPVEDIFLSWARLWTQPTYDVENLAVM